MVVARAPRHKKRGSEDLKWVLPRLVTVSEWVQLEGLNLNSLDMVDTVAVSRFRPRGFAGFNHLGN